MNECEIFFWCVVKLFFLELNRKLLWLRVGDFSLFDVLEGEGENGVLKLGIVIIKKNNFFFIKCK